VWYRPATVAAVTDSVGAALQQLLPGAEDYLATRAASWQAQLTRYEDGVAAAADTAAGHTYAATEPLFDDMAMAIGLQDVTPAGYQEAAANEVEPGPADLAALEAAIEARQMALLVVSSQTDGALTGRLRDAAAAAHVPVVEVTETVPAGQTFVEWQLGQLRSVTGTLGG
jgi:zinc/manganese transport system substrate-binding protein